MNVKRLQTLLLTLDNPRRNLTIFGAGTLVFFLGCGVLIWVNQKLPDSLIQEWIALISLIVATLGAIIAATGYLLLSLLRIIHFMQSGKNTSADNLHDQKTEPSSEKKAEQKAEHSTTTDNELAHQTKHTVETPHHD
jgi:uncharacterized membrane protein YcjF (UPF0283 family)